MVFIHSDRHLEAFRYFAKISIRVLSERTPIAKMRHPNVSRNHVGGDASVHYHIQLKRAKECE